MQQTKQAGKDNITVVLVENDKSPQTHEATKPVITQTNTVLLTEKDETISEPLKISTTENIVRKEIVDKKIIKQKVIFWLLGFYLPCILLALH